MRYNLSSSEGRREAERAADNISNRPVQNFKLYCVFLTENKLNANHRGIDKYF